MEEGAIELFAKHLEDDQQLRSALWTLSGLRLVCHCGLQQSCRHADALISAFADEFPDAFDRNDTSASPLPTSLQLSRIRARVRVQMKERCLMEQGGQDRGNQCRSDLVTQSMTSVTVSPWLLVRHLEDSRGSCQEGLRT